MSVYTRFVSQAVFPLQERLKKHDTVRVRRAMEASQWWPAAQLEAFQRDRLRAFLSDVGAHVPYYRQVFSDAGFDPAKISRVADLQRLPFLTKPLIRANTEALRADDARALARFNTGGSSGEPLIFFIGDERVTHDVAAKWRATRWWDVDIGDREIVVWGSPIELGAQDRVRQFRDALMRTELMPAFEMSETKLDGFVARIRARRPAMLFGYPSAISHIARHAEKRGIRLDDLGVRVVFVTSERLYDDQRESIERLFGCPVANGYGGRDAGFIAHQCPSGSMHITAEDIVVEIVDASGQVLPSGQSGEIVVTHLATRDFPFIRYRTGDIGVLDDTPCACGRGLPVLKEIQGRSTDFVIALDGTVMHGLSLIYVLRDIPAVRAFKIIQETLTLTRVQVEPGEGFSDGDVALIQSGLQARLGASVEIVVEQVAQVAPERSGKFRYVISKIAG
ncbi:phenylacetate--CoA ligase family protein [Denitromonas ohlonensis]|uniref:Phenylacetate--CoA ligase family protein n=2 Tax=Denitromonas TaxID=139331 RepID=A0A557RCL6_9RHOO|nr:AMP-binding protein [Denitromonas ohlonensis]TVO62887.1 phenylacetate--CoA ligase family protein [Denitromonas ohlonensis]TVO74996.1 phenylacetate--CoA ligase family protein [Denitromonas ohlonensis]